MSIIGNDELLPGATPPEAHRKIEPECAFETPVAFPVFFILDAFPYRGIQGISANNDANEPRPHLDVVDDRQEDPPLLGRPRIGDPIAQVGRLPQQRLQAIWRCVRRPLADDA